MFPKRSALCCGIAVLAALCMTGPRAIAQLPDIRGLNFNPYFGAFFGITDFGGVVETPLGNFPADINPSGNGYYFGVRPHTFDVVADPAAPNDPSQIQINTRFVNIPSLEGYSAPDFDWELQGTYNQTTGAISVSQTQTGTFYFNEGTGQDIFGIFPFPTGDFIKMVNPTFSLHGTVERVNGGLEIVGTDQNPPFGGPGNISAEIPEVIFTTAYATEPTPENTLLALDVVPGTGYGTFYDWHATDVPEPGSLALLAGLGFPATVLVLRRRRVGKCERVLS